VDQYFGQTDDYFELNDSTSSTVKEPEEEKDQDEYE
jgi:hypothetical protein